MRRARLSSHLTEVVSKLPVQVGRAVGQPEGGIVMRSHRSKGVLKLRNFPAALTLAVGLVGLPAAIAVSSVTPAAASTTLCSGDSYSTCTNAGYTDHGYSSHKSISYWGAITGHNCTNYAAYLEDTVNGAPTPSYQLGNADTWGTNASAHGVSVNDTPGLGSVAWWNQADGERDGMGLAGHVAYVEDVSGSPGSYTITISEDANPSGPFDWMNISQGDSRWPTGFIHFKDFPPGSSSGTLWGINTGGQTMRYAGNAQWTYQGGPAFKDIAADSDGSTVAAVSTTGAVYTYTGNDAWHMVSGQILTDVADQAGTLWGINTSGQAMRYAGNAQWTYQGGPPFKDITASGSTVAAVSTTGTVYTYAGNGTWHMVSGQILTDVAVQ
jgi:surface antigen